MSSSRSENGQRNKTITVNGRPVVVRELTVGEIGGWLDEKLNPAAEAAKHPLAAMLPVGDLMLGDLFMMTDLDSDAVNDMTSSDLEEIALRCREVNQSFFALVATLVMAGNVALNQLSTTSTDAQPA